MSKKTETTTNNPPKKHSTNNKNKRKHINKFSTNSGHPLTPLEATFIDLYIATGNGRKSVMEAGYKTKAPGQYAQELLKKPYITEEINYRLELHKQQSIADATEILQYLTGVMRGEIKDQFGLDAPLGERTKAAQELAKRQIDIPNKVNGKGEGTGEVHIVLNWDRTPDDSQNE